MLLADVAAPSFFETTSGVALLCVVGALVIGACIFVVIKLVNKKNKKK